MLLANMLQLHLVPKVACLNKIIRDCIHSLLYVNMQTPHIFAYHSHTHTPTQ